MNINFAVAARFERATEGVKPMVNYPIENNTLIPPSVIPLHHATKYK